MKTKRNLDIDRIVDAMNVIIETENQAKCLEVDQVTQISDSQWINLQCPEKLSLSYMRHCEADSSILLLSIAHLLGLQLRKTLPSELSLKGLTLNTQGNTTHFCISGSIPATDIETLGEYLKAQLQDQEKK